MTVITLHRTETEGLAVHGKLTLPFATNPLTYDTLENADHLIPEGTYHLKMTWSNRFKKFMPEICNVPDREGIRIHMGTKPEHSTGCVLMSYLGLENTKAFINRIKTIFEDEEELCIEIVSDTPAD